ncbi:MAG TPA: hypothetical protein P5186_14085 [Candidatus Paceibacterota bacterium]|nr:hypothetical protein [Verrucomicrobiota bacterium]HRY49174.1 hypothetical protein [Candidatus Paceibacterota bacterium]
MGKPFVNYGSLRRSLSTGILAGLAAHAMIVDGEEVSKVIGRFDRHVVEVTWSGACATYSHTTNTYSDAEVLLPMSVLPRTCLDGKIELDGMLALIFPAVTPPASLGSSDSLVFNPPLNANVSLEGDLTIPNAPRNNTQKLTLMAGPIGAGTTNLCPFSTVTHGPPLSSGANPLRVMWSCQRSTLTSPEREGTDWVYRLVSTVSIQLQEPALSFPSSFLLGCTINIKSYYRVDIAGGMQLDPAQLTFDVTRSNPPPQTVTVRNAGKTNLNFHVSTATENSKPWLQVGPLVGTLAPGQVTNLFVQIESGALNPGTNTGFITLIGNASNSPKILPVKVMATDLELVALEIIQAVQNWRNSVPLIADKPTLVRAHLQLLRPMIPPKILQGLQLRGFRTGVELAESPLGAINAGGILVHTNSNQRRSTLASSLNFDLPRGWLTANLELRLEPGAEPILFHEPAERGGVAGDGRIHVGFDPVPEFKIHFIQVRWTNANGRVFQPGTNEVDKLKLSLQAGFPVSRVKATRGQLIWQNGSPILEEVNALIALMRMQDPSGRLYYGIITGIDLGGLAQGIPSDISSGVLTGDPSDYTRTLHMHEIGHTLGQHHTVHSVLGLTTNGYKQGYCGEVADAIAPDYPFFAPLRSAGMIPALGDMLSGPEHLIYGFDRSAWIVVDPYRTAELMSYCEFRTQWVWPSVYTYTNLWLAISNRFKAAPAIHAAGPALEWQEYLVVRGAVNLVSGAAQFLPFTRLRTSQTITPPPVGEYTLEFLNAAGSIQQVIPFALVTGVPDYATKLPETGSILVPVAANPAIRQVRLRHRGVMILSRSASLSSPSLRVLQPNGGETIGTGSAELEWMAGDADGDVLSYLIQFSADNGSSWETLAADWPLNRYTIDAEFLRGTTEGRIRVIASDGFNTAVDESDKPFTVLNRPPNASIRLPASGTLFSGEQAVVMTATASDLEDGSFPDENLQWTSDVDGWIGSGEYLQRPASAFTEGPHLIQLTVRDSYDSVNTATARILIQRHVPANLADLELIMEGGRTAPAGIQFQIRLRNLGPTDANEVQFIVKPPPGVILVSATSSQGSTRIEAGTLQCSLGILAAGEEANLEVNLEYSGLLRGSFHVQATTQSTDPIPANNNDYFVLAELPVESEPVRLAFEVVAREIILSWPASAFGYVLESTDRLSESSRWQEHNNFEQAGGQNTFRITPAESCRFYRLRQQ